LAREQRRIHRAMVLLALKSETGSDDGSTAAPRIQAYCADPLGSSVTEFGFVGGLILRRGYIDPTKPTASERQSLRQAIREKMDLPISAVPSGWDGATDVMTLQQLAEETP